MYLSTLEDKHSFDHVTRNYRSRHHSRDWTGSYVLSNESFFSVLLYFRAHNYNKFDRQHSMYKNV